MKRRLGFVSNSSSSSFCVLGVTDEEITLPEDKDIWDLDGEELTVRSGISDYYDEYCIGISPSSISDNETIGQAKQRVVDLLKSEGVEVSIDIIGWMTDGGYDG